MAQKCVTVAQKCVTGTASDETQVNEGNPRAFSRTKEGIQKRGGGSRKSPSWKICQQKKTYIDKSVAADIQGAFETQERQTAGGKGRSNIEDGFRGSALISAPRPAAPTVVAMDAPVEIVAVYN